MPLQLPDGYSIFATSNNGQTLTAVRDGHSAGKPLLFIIDRTEAKYNANTQKYSVPVYRVRVIRGTVDQDGKPQGERLLADCSFRVPVGSADEVSDLIQDLNDFITQTQFQEEGVINHFFPMEASGS